MCLTNYFKYLHFFRSKCLCQIEFNLFEQTINWCNQGLAVSFYSLPSLVKVSAAVVVLVVVVFALFHTLCHCQWDSASHVVRSKDTSPV